MREIKFRAINKDNIAYGFFNALHHRTFTLKGLISVPSIEIMQYTGLKDKNGKEIYEGDLMNHEDFKNIAAKVEIINGCTYLGGWDCVRTDLSLGEIIGNIYEK